MFNIDSLSLILNSAFDLASVSLITGLLFLSLVALAFVFYLHLKSRYSYHLQHFNSLWAVRFLLVFLITLWALNDLLRLPIVRRRYLYPFFPSLDLSQQANLCKLHVALSLGLFEPGFLVVLLFLVNVSIKKNTPRGSWAIAFISVTCLPILSLQVVVLFTSTIEGLLPPIFWRGSVVSKSSHEKETVFCSYPLMNTLIFGAFGIWYLIGFSLSYYKAVTLVINKGLRTRLYWLAFAVMVTLPLEIVALALSLLWKPEETAFAAFVFLVFFTTLVLAVVGEGILVIRPITDSLAASEDACQLSSGDQWRPEEEGRRQELMDRIISIRA
ncbi:hypothetical protein K2173_005964 [Erythroxylum novogranatense]|uniref:Uncharacterized protein n=1 Tax=Erythroxylum novogranatense TaxID=1862640 RepID=A0AAV8TVJ1_9ROSI|nr:hypothetical protein K2173_005964 [Erythroxylum novogranatense]